MSTTLADMLNEICDPIKRLSKFAIEIGVVEAKTRRKISLGVTNAELMFIHEHGSPLKHIPSRPVLEMTIKHFQKNAVTSDYIQNCCYGILTKQWTDAQILKELNKLALEMQNYARDLIYSNDGRLVANSTNVANAKHGNHPLFDTGQLARSITCRAIKM